MANITIPAFKGSVPRLAEHLLGKGVASFALDCKLWDGQIASWREPLLIRQTSNGVAKIDCCWIDLPSHCIDVAEGSVACKKIFATGVEDYPVYGVLDTEACTVQWKRLGVPCPKDAPDFSIISDTVPDKDTDGRAYAYRYVNADGDKGALSAPSKTELVNDGAGIIVTGWTAPDPSWNVTHVEIFRTVVGYDTPQNQTNTLDVVWMKVGTAPINMPTFSESVYNEDLSEALVDEVVEPPPADLKNIISISGTNTLAGFSGNKVYFSHNNEYHNWPYSVELDDNICALAESSGVIYVATDGHPYSIAGDVDCKSAGCRTVVRFATPYPMAGCGSKRITAIPNGAVYISSRGAVVLSGKSQPSVITAPLYSVDQWRALIPESLIPCYHSGFIYFFGAVRSFCIHMPEGTEAGWDYDAHTELSDVVKDAFVSRAGELYLVKDTGVYQWDAGYVLRPHKWVSGESLSGTETDFAALKLRFSHGPERVILSTDKVHRIVDRNVSNNIPVRLPRYSLASRFQVTFEGTGTVSHFSMATSIQELTA